jgi:D-inositol-3-phosphate glycosyltransferase
MMRRVLWNGDAGVATGFERVTRAVLEEVRKTWEVRVLGINYYGDPVEPPYPYPVYNASLGGDSWGINRLEEICEGFRPDLVVIQNDPWNVVEYAQVLKPLGIPVAAYMPVDGLNVKSGRALTGLAHAIFYTDFALAEARAGGYDGPGSVVPLGVDQAVYFPVPQEIARERIGLTQHFGQDIYIVGNVNRNQPRKRIDLTISYFAEWVKAFDVRDAYLYLHMAPTGDRGWNLPQLCQYYGIEDRLIVTSRDMETGRGVDQSMLNYIYNSFDVQISTTQGEGWGLTTMEGMACEVPQIVPDWSALGEWTKDGAIRVPCSSIAVTPSEVNIIGGIPDAEATVNALDFLYKNRHVREDMGRRALNVVSVPDYRWSAIGQKFAAILDSIPLGNVKESSRENSHSEAVAV